jgi:hypothetical protein
VFLIGLATLAQSCHISRNTRVPLSSRALVLKRAKADRAGTGGGGRAVRVTGAEEAVRAGEVRCPVLGERVGCGAGITHSEKPRLLIFGWIVRFYFVKLNTEII